MENQKDNNINNIHLISLLNKKILSNGEKKLFDIKSNFNSFSPYAKKMISNASKLVKYNPNKYLLNELLSSNNENSNNSYYKQHMKKKNNFYDLDAQSLYLDEMDSPNNLKNIKYLSKSPSVIVTHIKDKNCKINENLFSKDDEIIVNKIFNKTFMNNNKFINEDKKEISHFFEKYSIDKDLSYEEKKKIQKTINNSRFENKKICLISSMDLNDLSNNEIFTKTNTITKDYDNPYHSLENLKLKSQIKETVGKIRDNLQFKKFQEQFKLLCDLKINKSRMPNIKALNKPNLIKKKDLLKNKNVINYFKQHKNNILNRKKFKDINLDKKYEYPQKNNYEEAEEKVKLSYEQKLKNIKFEIWHLEFNYHPESRLMSSICFDFEEQKLYNYGGIGGKIYGDLWECKFNENKRLWKRIYTFNYNSKDLNIYHNNPLPRYGHTCHFYKKKIYLVGGEFIDWKRDVPFEELLWIYDIEKKEWNSLHKYELKSKMILDRRSTKSLNLFKLKKNFSDILLKIPLLIPQNLNGPKNHKNKIINKTLFTKNKKKEKKNYKKLSPCKRRNHISLLIGTHIFIYGGISSNEKILNDCWIYDLKSYKWENIETIGINPPYLGHHCSCFAIEKGQLINDSFNIFHKPQNNIGNVNILKMDGAFFFGGINENKTPSNLFFHMSIGVKPVIFDIPNTIGKPPNARVDASMDFAQNLNMIIIYGGNNEFEAPFYYGDMILLDLRNLNWIYPSFMKENLINRSQHLSIIIGDELIIFGGTTGKQMLNYDFTVFDLDFNK